MPLTIELPSRESLAEFNRRRWDELLADATLARIEGRIETDRHGHIIMIPPASGSHGSLQFEIAYQLRTHLPHGHVITECPISTSDGVRVTDVGWFSARRFEKVRQDNCYSIAPEICVEVLSPSNSNAEVREKTALYLEAGAGEVWLCAADGSLAFHSAELTLPVSRLCPDFPLRISLP